MTTKRARAEAAHRANALARAITLLRDARKEAASAGFDLGARGDEREMLRALEADAHVTGHTAVDYLAEDGCEVVIVEEDA